MHNPIHTSDDEIERALRGEIIYGDNFPPDRVAVWYEEEERGYFDVSTEKGGHTQTYRSSDALHFFRGREIGGDLLAVGAADGSDFLSVAEKINEFHFIEISEEFWRSEVGGKPAFYSKPSIMGEMSYEDARFDVGAFFSVLHHVPNVSFALKEMHRVLKPGGLLLLREPVVSMGDWRTGRPGLTKNERGIPQACLETAVYEAGFEIEMKRPFIHPLVRRVSESLGFLTPYNHTLPSLLDMWISQIPIGSHVYHPQNVWQKLRPQGVAMILRKE